MTKRKRAEQNRILVVDDQCDILDIIARVLTGAGYACDTAPNGEAALVCLADKPYDLLVSNLRMPVMDGEALYHRVCLQYPHLRRRIVFCTGDTATGAAQSFLQATGAPVLLKPFELKALLEAVTSKLGRDLPSPPARPSASYWQDSVAVPV